MVEWWLAWFTTLAAAALGWFWHWHVQQVAHRKGVRSVEELIRAAREKADVIVREAESKAREVQHDFRKEFELESRERRERLDIMEDKAHERLVLLETKAVKMDEREILLDKRLEQLEQQQLALETHSRELDALRAEQENALQKIAGLSPQEAKENMIARLEEEARKESEHLFRKAQSDAQQRAKLEAQKIITYAIERYAAQTVNDVTTTAVHLPSEEMKGRIIGKEGRNIRAIESETGVNVVIDDTPQTVVLSGYDPMRREIATQALTRLVEDGRIHPASIEETVKKVREEVEDSVRKAGENAVFELGLGRMHPEIVYTLGRLKYRQSYSQNVLSHSIEMAHLMGSMAAELGLDIQRSKRIGLLHDLGKALTHEVEGSHALIGAELLKRHGEEDLVVNAVAAHHREVEAESVYAHLAMAADAVTAARPGARNENTQQYLQRLGDLEEIANRHDGVSQSYAIQAGRELRVLVKPETVSDERAMELAREISKEIGEAVHFPGQVKVTVIRETRSVDYAR